MVKRLKIIQWAIRIQAPNVAILDYGEGSTTKCLWVGEVDNFDEGLRYSLDPMLADASIKYHESEGINDLQRKLMKNMEDLYISSGGYVQNSNGQIVQFIYGNDCMDGSKLEKQTTTLGTCSDIEFARDYIISIEDLTNTVIKKFVPTDNNFQEKELELLRELRNQIKGTYYYVPFNIDRIISSVKAQMKVSVKKTQVSSDWVYNQLTLFIDSLRINKILDKLKPEMLTFTNYILWSKLSTKMIVMKHKLNKKMVKQVLEQIKENFDKSLVQTGEMVGPIAAQSIGEKLTQCVLDSFHSSGIASKTQMSGGVQRFQEIIHVSKKPNNPALLIKLLNPEVSTLKKLQEQIRYTDLKFFLKSFSIYYDANNDATGDNDLIQSHIDWFPSDLGQSPWVIVLEIEPSALYKKKIDMSVIVSVVNKFAIDNYLVLIASDHNAPSLKIHLRPQEHTENDYDTLKALHISLMDITVCGIQGITETEICDGNIGAISEGTQLREILALPYVDTYNTSSTNIHEILEIFGIEATRQLIIEEIYKFLQQNGVYVNERHIELLSDFITNQGILIALDRHGIAKSHHSVLTAGSFETVVPFLSKAGIYGDRDNLNGVSPNIIMGQIGQFGTGMSSLLIE